MKELYDSDCYLREEYESSCKSNGADLFAEEESRPKKVKMMKKRKTDKGRASDSEDEIPPSPQKDVRKRKVPVPARKRNPFLKGTSNKVPSRFVPKPCTVLLRDISKDPAYKGHFPHVRKLFTTSPVPKLPPAFIPKLMEVMEAIGELAKGIKVPQPLSPPRRVSSPVGQLYDPASVFDYPDSPEYNPVFPSVQDSSYSSDSSSDNDTILPDERDLTKASPSWRNRSPPPASPSPPPTSQSPNPLPPTTSSPTPSSSTAIQCPECQQTCSTKLSFIRHWKRTHTGKAPNLSQKSLVVCDKCHKSFGKSNAARHAMRCRYPQASNPGGRTAFADTVFGKMEAKFNKFKAMQTGKADLETKIKWFTEERGYNSQDRCVHKDFARFMLDTEGLTIKSVMCYIPTFKYMVEYGEQNPIMNVAGVEKKFKPRDVYNIFNSWKFEPDTFVFQSSEQLVEAAKLAPSPGMFTHTLAMETHYVNYVGYILDRKNQDGSIEERFMYFESTVKQTKDALSVVSKKNKQENVNFNARRVDKFNYEACMAAGVMWFRSEYRNKMIDDERYFLSKSATECRNFLFVETHLQSCGNRAQGALLLTMAM